MQLNFNVIYVNIIGVNYLDPKIITCVVSTIQIIDITCNFLTLIFFSSVMMVSFL